VNVNVFILKSPYSQFPTFNTAQDTCSWKLLQVTFLKNVSCRHNVTGCISNRHRFRDKYYIQKHACDEFITDYETSTCAIRDKLLQTVNTMQTSWLLMAVKTYFKFQSNISISILTYLLIPWSRVLQANRFSASQGIPHSLWNTKVHYRIHRCPPPLPNLCPFDSVRVPTFTS